MRRLIKYVLYLLLVVVALIAILLGGLATPIGRNVLAAVIERVASSDDLAISIERMTGWPPFRVGADKIVLSDGSGQFAEIDGLSVDVGIMRLLTGTIAIDDLTAARVAFDRMPETGEGGESGGGGLMPFAVDRLSIAELSLGEALAGRPAVVSIEGSAAAGADGSLRANVAGKRIDGGQGTFSAKLERADGDALIAADIEVAEAADGILVGLIGRPSGPAYQLSAKAAPDGDALRGSVSLASEHSTQFNGQFSLAPDNGMKRLRVTANGDVSELVPPEYAALLAGPVDIVLDADWQTVEGSMVPEVAIRQGQVRTAAIDASASGTVSRQVADLSLQVNIADPAGATLALPMLPEPSELRSVSLRGTVAPSNGIVRADLVGNVTDLRLAGVSVPATGLSLAIETVSGGTPFVGKLPFALRIEADAVRTASGDIVATDAAPLLVVANGTIDTQTITAEADIDIRAGGGQVQFNGAVSPATMTGTANATFANLATLSGIAGRDLSGAISADVDGSFFSADGTDLRLSASLTDIDPGEETAARMMRGATTVTGQVTTDRDGSLAISDLQVSGQTVQATANATLDGQAITATLQGTIADLAVLAENTSGSANLSADVSGTITRPEIDATIGVDDGELIGRAIRNASVRVEGGPSEQGWSANATLDGSFADKPLSGNVEVVGATAESDLSFPAVDLTIDNNRIHGALARTGDGLFDGALDVEAPDLSTLAALILVEASGSAEAKVSLTPTNGRQTVAVDFTGSDIAYTSINARSIEGQARVDDALGTPRIDGSVQVAEATAGSVQLDRVTAEASSDGATTSFQLAANGPDIDLSGSGSLSSDAGASILGVETLSGSAFNVPVKLQSPVTARFDDSTTGLPTMRIAVGGGSVVIDGSVSPDLNVSVAVEGLPAAIANGFAPTLGAAGTLSAKATVTGSTASPTVAWQAGWAGMQIAATQSAGLPALELSASGDATMTQATIDGTLSGAGLSVNFKGTVPYAGDGLAVEATGRAPLALLALETARELRLDGDANIDVKVTGATTSPNIVGTATLENVTVIDGETGFGVTGATGQVTFDGQRAATERISGNIAQGGQITVSGSVDVSGQFPADIKVVIDDGRYNDGEVVNALFDANVAVNGPLLGGATASGTVALGRTEVQLPSSFSSSTVMDVKHINAPPSFVPPLLPEPQPESGSSPTGDLKLDIEVSNSLGIFVRGFGVDAEFGGSLRITNTISDPQAVGGFELRRGRIEVIGRRFDLTTGTLTFAGDLTPYVEFVATTSTSEAVVAVNVIGPADDPNITFTSTPELPEEEILAQILFGRSVSSLSPLQIAQLLDAVAQFSGGSSGQGIFSRVRNALGVDDLDIHQNASGGTTVGIGKRINENVTLGVDAGTGGAESRVRIDLDLTPNLKATGSAGDDGSGSLGFTFEREY